MQTQDAHDLSRRTFLKTSAAVGAAVTVTGALSAKVLGAPSVRTRSAKDPLKIGVVGLGGRGTGATIQALTADADTILWSVGDLFPDRANPSLASIKGHLAEKQQESRFQVTPERTFFGFDAYRAVIDSGVDVVLLTSYPYARPEHFRYAVEKGKHIFAEKPCAVDVPGLRIVREAAEAAASKKLVVVSGFNWRYADAEKAAYAKLHEGVIGPVLACHTTFHTGTLPKRPRKPEWTDIEFQIRNWWHFLWVAGDHIVEQAVHSLDRMSWAFNDQDPLRCVALGGRAAREGPEHGNVYDHFSCIFDYPGGRRGFHTCRQIDNCPSDNADYIFAAGGTGVINGWANRQEFLDPAGNRLWAYDGPRKDMYQNEHDHLFKCIREGKPHNDGAIYVRSSMLAIMGRMAAYTGQAVTWEQAWASTESLVPTPLAFGPYAMTPVPIPGRTPLR